MQIVHEISEGSASSGKLFNAAHVYSTLNRKMIAPVDNAGNCQGFALNVKVYSDAANTATFETASNSYVTKQAVKQWFRAWRASILAAGTSFKDLGPYGRVFKPRLQASETLLGSGTEIGRGEWNYSDMVVTASVDPSSTAALEANDLNDQYLLHITGSTVAQTGTGDETKKFTSVGMIESWLGSRKGPAGAESGTSVPASLQIDQDNPLQLARGNRVSSELMLDEIRDLQVDEPPYDHLNLAGLYTQAIVKTNEHLMAECDIVAPCGLVKVTTTAASTIVFTLVGIGDM